MITRENLEEAFYSAKDGHERSPSYIAFELNRSFSLDSLYKHLCDHTFIPSSYVFIVFEPRPREVFACDTATRVVHHYLMMRIRPILEKILTNRTFNNRKGYGTSKAIDQVRQDIKEMTNNYTTDAYIIKLDLKGFFPNAVRQIAYDQICDLITKYYEGDDKEDLYYLAEISILYDPTKNCRYESPKELWEKYIPDEKSVFKRPEGIGGAIGYLSWQICMNYYIHMIDVFLCSFDCMRVVRFVDDIVIITTNKELTLSLIPKIREMLAEVGCKLSENKFYCQHYTKGLEFIGTHIKEDRIYINNRIYNRFRYKAEKFFDIINETNCQKFLDVSNSYLGMLKHYNQHDKIMDFLESLTPRCWKYVHYNPKKQCLNLNYRYNYHNRVFNDLHLIVRSGKSKNRNKNKHHNNDRKRTKKSSARTKSN